MENIPEKQDGMLSDADAIEVIFERCSFNQMAWALDTMTKVLVKRRVRSSELKLAKKLSVSSIYSAKDALKLAAQIETKNMAQDYKRWKHQRDKLRNN